MNTSNKVQESGFKAQLVSAKIKMLYKNLYFSTPINFLCASIVFLCLYQESNYSFINLSWFIAVLCISCLRLASLYFYNLLTDKNSLLYILFIIGVILSALLWGFCASFLMPQNAWHQTIIIVIIAGVTAGGLQMLQASFVANTLYLTTVISPVCIWLFLQGGPSHFVLSFAMSGYLLFTLVTAWRGYKIIDQSLHLNFENIALVSELSASNKKLLDAYHTIEENAIRTRDIQENAPIGMAVISLEGEWLEINQALCHILGYSKDELKKVSLQDITFSEDLAEAMSNRVKMLQRVVLNFQTERRYVHKNGQIIWTLINESLLQNNAGESLYFIFQIQDISERKKNELMVMSLNEKTRLMLTQLQQREIEMGFINKMNETLQTCQDSSEAFLIIGNFAEALFLQFSGGFIIADNEIPYLETKKQWGSQQILKKEISHKDCWALRTGHAYVVDDPKKNLICNHFDEVPSGGYICVPQISQTGVIGLIVLIAPEANMISLHQQQLVSSFNDVIKLSLTNIRLLEILNDQSIHDPLTQLYNRRFLDETLIRELSRATRDNGQLCVCMLDIDYFKQFNDVNGHEAGDDVLKFIGKFLLENTRKVDVACRFGGEEFVLVFINSTISTILPKLQEMCEKIRNFPVYSRNNRLPQVTVSVGIAEAPKHGSTYKDILKAADEALYSAKQNGRNRIVVFEKRDIKHQTEEENYTAVYN